MSNDEQRLRLMKFIDGRLSEQERAEIENELAASSALREQFVALLALEHDLRNSSTLSSTVITSPRRSKLFGRPTIFHRVIQVALAASFMLVVSWLMTVTYLNNSTSIDGKGNDETTLTGFATVRRLLNVEWTNKNTALTVGDTIPAGLLSFEKGMAEIDMFCGARLVIEGPAQLDLKSDWLVHCLAGRVRAQVPQAAQGFIIKAADKEIVDLGTEFVLEVNQHASRVQVIDGKIRIQESGAIKSELITGQSEVLHGNPQANQASLASIVNDIQFSNRHEALAQLRYDQWQKFSRQLRNDPRLIAYFPMANEPVMGRLISNRSTGGSAFDGSIVGLVDQVPNRFGQGDHVSLGNHFNLGANALSFSRPGARVRVRIDGEFEAFTFICWAKIDSLHHQYNALFMGDGYENGEPHWQIREDGQLMFSVMIDDQRRVMVRPKYENGLVADAGWHRVYFSPPIWDMSKSGQWIHLASTYDPTNRRVAHYVNGAEVSRHEIVPEYYCKDLRIGPGEIGNWGQPFRRTPAFSVRNLNGTIDEMTIFNAALSKEEIHAIYDVGRPSP
jgi:hypothetical protein